MRILTFILIFILSTASFGQVQVRYQSSAEKTFGTALRSFETGKFRNAYVLYDSLIRMEPAHQRTTASYLMASKCLQRMKSYRSSIVLLKDFINRFPVSSYIPDAYYSIGVSSVLSQDHFGAGKNLLVCLDLAKSEKSRSAAIELFSALADYRYGLNELKELASVPDSQMSKDLVDLKLAEKYADKGKADEARDILTGVLSRTKISVFHNRFRQIYESLRTARPSIVGVVLPASEETQRPSVRLLASEIGEGMTFAADEYRSAHPSSESWSLNIRNVSHRTDESIEMVKKLAIDPGVGVIVGPLYSEAVIACARIAADEDVPVILPTATYSGDVGRSHIFQMTPDDEICGKLMARHAVERENLKTFAILSSEEENARAFAESFSNEAKKLGAVILVHEQYASGVSDLRDQFMNIRKAGFGKQKQTDFAANIEKSMTAIDGVLLSIGNREDIGIVASQLSYYNIKSCLLGNSVWDDRVQLQKNRSYIEGIIFGTGELFEESEGKVLDFKRNYFQRMKKYPSIYSALGYDIMMLIIELVEDGARTRAELREALSGLRDYRGIRSSISFSGNGINSGMFIIEFREGELEKITEVSLK